MQRQNKHPGQAMPESQPGEGERDALEKVASRVGPGGFAAMLDPTMRETLAHGFAEAGAHEGTVWLVDEQGDNLVPAYNTGPQAAEVVGNFKQPLRTGLVCMVFASEQPFVENEVGRNLQQSKLLDERLQVETWAMIAVPFYILGRCRGVVSCVQLKRSPSRASPPGFPPESLASVQRACERLTDLLDLRLLREALARGHD
jgi:hypothetical protein